MTTRVSRRAVAKGTAWSIPAIAVASAAPAVAASDDCNPETNKVTLNVWDKDFDIDIVAIDPATGETWPDNAQQFQYKYTVTAGSTLLPTGAVFKMNLGFGVPNGTTPTVTPLDGTGFTAAVSDFTRDFSSKNIEQYAFIYTFTLTQDIAPGQSLTGLINVSREFDPALGFDARIVRRISLPDQTFVTQCQTITISYK